jgi:hypothetical protein
MKNFLTQKLRQKFEEILRLVRKIEVLVNF